MSESDDRLLKTDARNVHHFVLQRLIRGTFNYDCARSVAANVAHAQRRQRRCSWRLQRCPCSLPAYLPSHTAHAPRRYYLDGHVAFSVAPLLRALTNLWADCIFLSDPYLDKTISVEGILLFIVFIYFLQNWMLCDRFEVAYLNHKW